MAMESGALSTAEFREFIKSYVPFCHITTHIEGDAYQKLLSEKGGRGFPYLVAMDADGNLLAKHAGPRTTEGFQATMQKAKEFQVLLEKEDLTPEEQIQVFNQRLDLGHFTVEEAKAEMAKLGELTDEQKAEIDGKLLHLEIQSHAPSSSADLAASGGAYAKMYQEGRVPTAGRDMETFFVCILEYAYQQKDAGLFEDALGKLKDAFGSNPRAKGFFDKQDARLAELKAE